MLLHGNMEYMKTMDFCFLCIAPHESLVYGSATQIIHMRANFTGKRENCYLEGH